MIYFQASTTTTTSTSTTTAISSSTEEIETTPPPTILPASTSKWKEVELRDASTILMVKPSAGLQTSTTIAPKVETNEIIEEIAKDGTSKLVVVQALHHASGAKDRTGELLEPIPPMVDLGIFGSFWLQKPKANSNNRGSSSPRPAVLKKEDYLDKFPELKM